MLSRARLVGLLESEWSPCFLFQTLETISAEAIQATVGRAVAAFMRAYGPAEGEGPEEVM